MRQSIKLSLLSLSLCLGFIAGCAEPEIETMPLAALSEAGLHYYWEFDLQLVGNESISRLERIDENLYCVTDSNRLIVIDAARGVPKPTG